MAPAYDVNGVRDTFIIQFDKPMKEMANVVALHDRMRIYVTGVHETITIGELCEKYLHGVGPMHVQDYRNGLKSSPN